MLFDMWRYEAMSSTEYSDVRYEMGGFLFLAFFFILIRKRLSGLQRQTVLVGRANPICTYATHLNKREIETTPIVQMSKKEF